MRTYERKLITVGNSAGVTFPPEVLKALGLKAGDWLELSIQDGASGEVLGEIVITKSDVRERTRAHQSEGSRHRRALEARSTRAARAGVKK